MTEHEIRIEDHSGNIYYPHTKGDVVFTADGQSIEQKVNTHLAETMPHKTADGGYKWNARVNADNSITFIFEEVV